MGLTARKVRSGVNDGLRCQCLRSSGWRHVGRADMRLNSVIYRFRSATCGEQIVAKLARSSQPIDKDGGEVKREFQAMHKLQSLLPPAHQGGALTALGCLDIAGHAVLVTRWFDGKDAIRCARGSNPSVVAAVYRLIGTLLKKLHDACPESHQEGQLDVEAKLAYLLQQYARVWDNDAAAHALHLLRISAPRVGLARLQWSWLHGDFKPENVLSDGRTVVILDTQLNTHGVGTYDLASFLAHTLLASHEFGNGAIRKHYALLDREFLAGYGILGADGTAALRWTQLYCLLCQFGRYLSGGILSAGYANYRIAPLFTRIAAQLEETIAT